MDDVSGKALEVLSAVYVDATNTIRHYDTQRASFATVFSAILVGGFAALTSSSAQEALHKIFPLATGILTLISLISILALLKLEYLIGVQRSRAQIALVESQKIIGAVDFIRIAAEARSRHTKHIMAEIPLSYIWTLLVTVLFALNASLFIRSILLF